MCKCLKLSLRSPTVGRILKYDNGLVRYATSCVISCIIAARYGFICHPAILNYVVCSIKLNRSKYFSVAFSVPFLVFKISAMKCPLAIATIITTTMRANYHAAMQLCNNGTEDLLSDAENIML